MKRFLLLMLLCAAPCLAQTQDCNYAQNFASTTLTATSQLVAVPVTSNTGLALHLCSFTIQVQQGSTPVNWGLIAGTGTNCGTNTTLVTPAFLGVASLQQSIGQFLGNSGALRLPPGTNLCFYASGTVTGAVVQVTYTAF